MDTEGVTSLVDLTKSVLELTIFLYKSMPQGKEAASLDNDLSFIKEELEMMVSYLMDASEGRGHQSSATRTWVRQARDLTYDAEDYFQDFVVHLEKPPRLPSESQARKLVVDKIRGLRERMQQSNQRYKLIQESRPDNNTSATTGVLHDQLLASMPNYYASGQALLVGREKDKAHIIQIITKDDKTRQIVPIWGMGGLGKTALTTSIYKNQDISCIFEKNAWMTLSHPFSAEEFFKNLVMQLQQSDITLNEPLENMQLKDLIEVSNMLLQGRTYLIVLDNVSSISEWNFLMQHITEEGNASRIIVTTRQKSVAEHCSIENIYELKALEDISAIELFKKKVLMETENFDGRPEMVEQAKCILSKCNGHPLAIDTIGGFLATRPKTGLEWKKFNEQFSFEFEKNPSLEMIRTVLKSNSEALPYHLKLCFLYLSIFPKDQNIRRRRLVRRWIAEGYSYGTHNRTAEENGEGYFAELISRSIIQPSELVAASGLTIDYCRVHNLLHEISVSESVEEKFSFVLDNRSNLQTNDKIRHLSVDSSWKRAEDELKSIGNLSQLRSLSVCGEWQSFFISEGMVMIRVLDLEGACGLKDHHVKHIIAKLIHLKYLSLRGCVGLYNLPDSLGNLWDLQTLDVRGTPIIVLPATIAKLRKLQYLRAGLIAEDEQLRDPLGVRDMEDGMPAALKWTTATVGLAATMVRPQLLDADCSRKDAFNVFCKNVFPGLARGLDIHGVEVPKGIGNLHSMHTLGVVNLSAGKAAMATELGNASQMRKLGVTGIKTDNSQQFFSAISKLIHLESLSIRSEGKPGLQDCLDCKSSSPPKELRSLKLYGNLVTLPAWVSQLHYLAKLKLRSTRLEQEAIQVIGQLPLLTRLCLLQNAVEGKDQDLRFHFKSGSFPSLVLLQLDGLPDLRSVEFEQNATTTLEVLQVKGCSNMDKDGCSGLSSLQSLKQVSLEAGHGYDDKFMLELRTQLSGNPSRPILTEIYTT